MRHRILILKKRDREKKISPFFAIVLTLNKGGQTLRATHPVHIRGVVRGPGYPGTSNLPTL